MYKMATLSEVLYNDNNIYRILTIDEASNNVKHKKDYKDKLTCYECDRKICLKLYPTGNKTNHFAHYPTPDGIVPNCSSFDKKKGNDVGWHRLITGIVEDKYREIVIKKGNDKIRADIHNLGKTVEVQHSEISCKDIEKRESISYVDWIFDGTINDIKTYYLCGNICYIPIIENRSFQSIFIYTKNKVFIHIKHNLFFLLSNKNMFCYIKNGKQIPLLEGIFVDINYVIENTGMKGIVKSIPEELTIEHTLDYVTVNEIFEYQYKNIKKEVSTCTIAVFNNKIIDNEGIGKIEGIYVINESNIKKISSYKDGKLDGKYEE
jgi:hypothetical protein